MSLKKTLGTGTRMLASAAVAVVAIAMCGRADAAGFKSITDVPVSACANTAYLSDMDGRLWWNPAWKKRAAILVSNMAKVRSPKTTIDFVFDVGERIDPKSVRVTTSYEVEVPCVAERARDGASATAVNILFQTDLREMENRPFFVYWDNPDAKPARSGHDVVSIDNALAAESLASHLLAEGARNVHVAMLPRSFPNQMERVRGVASAVVQSGRSWSNARNVLRAEPTDVKAVRAYMKRRPRPDAFVCQNDAFAADFAQTLRALGYAIPKDVMIGGFDGMDIARVMALTTIQQPYAQIAQTVFDRLLHRVERPSGLPVRLFLPERLVIRASTQRKTKG